MDDDAAAGADELPQFDRRMVWVFAAVDAFCGLLLITVFMGAVVFDVLPIRGMDFNDVELSRLATVAEVAQIYTLIPFSAALFGLTIIGFLKRSPRAIAMAAFGVAATALLLLFCTVLVPWGRNEGWGPYLLGNGLILIGIIAHAWLGARLWRRTMATPLS